ncbi:MAG: transcription-repair coupling factor [Clostridia bacterium]|nr:transcription-repair coupling factor [Clostridia bacterium]
MNCILDSIRREREYSGIIETVEKQIKSKSPLPMLVTGMCEGARLSFYASLCEDVKKLTGHGILLVVADEKQALKVQNALCDSLVVLNYPYRDFIYHNITASHDFEHERLGVLSAVVSGEYDIITATPDALLQFTMPAMTYIDRTMTLEAGNDYSITELCDFLVLSGYVRVDMVSGKGQFSVRGSIVDIYPPRQKLPIRADFFGDTLDCIYVFDTLTQRRIGEVKKAEVTPAREIIASDDRRTALVDEISEQIKKCGKQQTKENLYAELAAVKSGEELHFSDKYISLIYPECECLLDYFTNKPVVVIEQYNAISDRLKSFEWHTRQSVSELLEEESISSKLCAYNKWTADFDFFCESNCSIMVDTFASGMTGKRLSGMFTIQTKQAASYGDNIELLREEMSDYLRANYNIVMLVENDVMAKNMMSMLSDDGISAAICTPEKCADGAVSIIPFNPFPGFELSVSKFAVITTFASTNSYSRSVVNKRRKAASKRSSKEKILSYADLSIGDYVVHVNHGIGQYLGLENLVIEGARKDFVKIKYAGSDMLYLPTDQLDMVSKYIGAHSDDGLLKLSKMGGKEWGKTKSRVKAAAREMAKELITLYAERMRREGFAFFPDDEYQREFEAAFEYEETDGQLLAVEEIKKDMEKAVPMDRLLCGDVGFGKTEVALRAAFKAICSSKQVAILVPTTILALQHYQTIVSRMRGFPVSCDMLSRFRTSKQISESLRKLRRGETDIIVGTHRLLSKDIEFKNLGLVIVDEEQRFGVAAKEKLKQISHNVDVLTLTATPIPRTLNMAMSGIRDMSVLEEARGDRLPVQTYVLEHDDLIIGEAIKKELRRGGQVFYLHNRVENIESTAARVLAMAGDDARVGVAHGKMDREQMSDVWKQMVEGEIDILVCTTIIETGVDVPNANTLIIEDADNMGLSQLHQIRGRVGRSSRRAYAYFTYPRGSSLTEIAEKRLMAIRDYTEFGSGFKIALRDLEIRGAGNLLGAEQHGHIDSIGYDMYMRLLNEAIIEEKGEAIKPKTECTVEISADAYIPEKYIASAIQRIDAYKKIASIENKADAKDVRDELCDRYGKVPKSVENLFMISMIRTLGSTLNFTKLKQLDSSLLIYPEKMDAAVWTSMIGDYKGRLLLNVSAKPYVSLRLKKGDDPLAEMYELLMKYTQNSNLNT